MSLASDFLLNDEIYADVRAGWNAKLRASSQQLSGLTPFVELYAVFASDDVIFQNPMMFSQVAGRAIDIKFQYTRGKIKDSPTEFQERFDIPVQAKIVPVASTAKSQTEHDTMGESSYRGAAGVNDLAVTRGASGPMNIKYDMNMTMPNPEVINEMYEYSKLMILNSKFLLVYGWNPYGFESSPSIEEDKYNIIPPPRLVNNSSPQGYPVPPNVVELNASNGGFYKSSLVTLNRFNFSLDNVGHLGGKLAFLTLAGNFLSVTRAEAVAASVKKQLNGYSGMLFTAGKPGKGSLQEEGKSRQDFINEQIEQAEEWLEESQAYAFAWKADLERRHRAWINSFNDAPDANGKYRTRRYEVEIGPPWTSNDKFRVITEETARAGNYTGGMHLMNAATSIYEEGMSEDDRVRTLFVNNHYDAIANIRPTNLSSGRYAMEVRMDPYGTNSRPQQEGYKKDPFGSDSAAIDEFRRYQRFSGYGPELVKGDDIPQNYDPSMDPLEFYQIDAADLADLPRDENFERKEGYEWAQKMTEWIEPGIGPNFGPREDVNGNKIPYLSKAFGRANQNSKPGYPYPTRLQDPQDLGNYQELLEVDEDGNYVHALGAIAADYKRIWQTEPEHEELALGYGFFPHEEEIKNDEGVGTGMIGVVYKPGEGANVEGYNQAYTEWFGEQVTDEYRTQGSQGTLLGIKPAYTNQPLKRIPYLEWYLAGLKKETEEQLGFMEITNGIPWAMPGRIPREAFDDYLGTNRDIKPTTLDTMPAYGRDLMNSIWDSFLETSNPNRNRFFPVNPESPFSSVTRGQLGQRFQPNPSTGGVGVDFLDPETTKIMQHSCAISTMMLDIAPPAENSEQEAADDWGIFSDLLAAFTGDETEEQKEARLADEEAQRSRAEERGTSYEPGLDANVGEALRDLATYEHNVSATDGSTESGTTMIAHAHPVYYFLGAVLEALKIAMADKVKFIYDDIPLDGTISPGGFPVPIPKMNKEAITKYREQIEKIEEEVKNWEEKYYVINSQHADHNMWENKATRGDHTFMEGEKTKKRMSALESAGYVYPAQESFEEGSQKLTIDLAGTPLVIDYSQPSDWSDSKKSRFELMEDKDLWGKAISPDEFLRLSGQKREKEAEIRAIANTMVEHSETIMSPLMCKNVFELPVSIAMIRKILNSSSAPLHSVINQVLKACNETTKTIKLATRPYAADESYLEIFVANIRVDGALTQVFNDIDVHGFLQSSFVRESVVNPGLITEDKYALARDANADTDPAALAAARSGILGAYFSKAAVVCEFGSERSLVESFNLSSKVDPLAFASFRLPDVIGGQSIDISEIVRSNVASGSMGLMNDIRDILEKGMYTGKQQLRDLQIIGETGAGGLTRVNTEQLRMFLLANTQTGTAAKVQTTFLTNLMASNQELNTKIISLQNEAITGSGDPNNPQNNSFYGGVLSTYLRSISLTIHGVVGLSMFNVVYIKGLMRGIEGLYLITTVSESITPAAFSTSLECKLIQYKDQNPDTNPIAGAKNITLAEVAQRAKGTTYTSFDALFDETERALEEDKNQGVLGYE